MTEQQEEAEKKANDAYRIACASINTIHGSATFEAQVERNNALGRNMLRTDLGDFGHYCYDEASAHRRLAENTRQDVATALAHAKSGFRYARGAHVFARATLVVSAAALFVGLINLYVLLSR